MHVLITGASGMIGRKLVDHLCKLKFLGEQQISAMTLVDIEKPSKPDVNWTISALSGDISDQKFVSKLIADKPDYIFHLAAIVSGEAEQNFSKGYSINFDGTRLFFEAIRKSNYCPRFVMASTIAVFGAPFPDKISDEFFSTPLTSYGVQKACSELLLMDYSRKGFFDGVAIRLPTIVIRPGKPNLAASGFFSNILREPLVGKEAILPVSHEVRHWLASPKAAIGFLVHAAELDTEIIGSRRALTMPGISVTVGEMIDALGKVAGPERVKLIKEEPNEEIDLIVKNWARDFNPRRALDLGFIADKSIEEIIKIHIEDELNGKLEGI